MPPNGSDDFRIAWPIWSSLSMSSPPSIETGKVGTEGAGQGSPAFVFDRAAGVGGGAHSPSSMIHTLAAFHLARMVLFRRMTLRCSLTGLSPRPIPANEWMVEPPTLHAAIPVDAVTTTAAGRAT